MYLKISEEPLSLEVRVETTSVEKRVVGKDAGFQPLHSPARLERKEQIEEEPKVRKKP